MKLSTLVIAMVVAATLAAPIAARRAAGGEFLGPFPSWTNVKTTYGAAGDGIADDTATIQAGLDDIVRNGRPPVLYLPGGRYRITRTLSLVYGLNVGIVGEDPDSTSIVWDGARGGTMLDVNGVAYSRINRITFDGSTLAAVAVEQRLDGRGGHFDTGNEYADDRFVDVGTGIHGGFGAGGFAETSILRARFIRNTAAGVALGNFNALDIWIWESLFEDCAVGVTNEPGAGNYRVYGSVFRRSTVADLRMRNTGSFTARGNYSVGSKTFFTSGDPFDHPAVIDIQGNTIAGTTDTTSIQLANQGPGLVLDNLIAGRGDFDAPAMRWRARRPVDVVSLGNRFSGRATFDVAGRLFQSGDGVVANAAAPAEPALPDADRSGGRVVFDVPSGSGADAIQHAIDAAVSAGGRAVVHLPFGVYAIDRTLTVPASAIQVVGDGYGTVLRWTGAGAGPVLRVTGPTRVTLEEFTVDAAERATGIVVENVDQPASRIFFDSVELRSGGDTNLLVDRLDEASVELRDFGHAGSRRGPSVRVIGGPARAAGETTGGRTVIFSGASSDNFLSYDISSGARVVVRDIWYEGRADGGFALVQGRASFTMQGSRVAMAAGGPVPAFRLVDLEGRVSLLTTHIDDRVEISGTGARADVLGASLFFETAAVPRIIDSSRPRARVVLLNSRQRTGDGGNDPVPVAGWPRADFVPVMLDDARAFVRPRTDAPPEPSSDLRLHRVWATNGVVNIVLRGR